MSAHVIVDILERCVAEAKAGNLKLTSLSTTLDGECKIEFTAINILVRDEFHREKMQELSKGTIMEGMFKS